MIIYTGQLNWYTYIIDEAFTLVIVNDIAEGHPIITSTQWSNSTSGPATPYIITSKIDNVTTTTGVGKIFRWEGSSYYRFKGELGAEPGSNVTLTMSNPQGDTSTNSLSLSYSLAPNNAKIIGVSVGIGVVFLALVGVLLTHLVLMRRIKREKQEAVLEKEQAVQAKQKVDQGVSNTGSMGYGVDAYTDGRIQELHSVIHGDELIMFSMAYIPNLHLSTGPQFETPVDPPGGVAD
jgi:hypothetical protein